MAANDWHSLNIPSYFIPNTPWISLANFVSGFALQAAVVAFVKKLQHIKLPCKHATETPQYCERSTNVMDHFALPMILTKNEHFFSSFFIPLPVIYSLC